MFTLYVEAPFATFRTFAAESFRPTASFLTHSAAYGLLLNIAGIEMRFDDGRSVMTLIKADLPSVSIAVGAIAEEKSAFVPPMTQSLFQQIHNYPVGTSGKERAPLTKGNKYNIVPARRAFLADLRAYIAVRGDEVLEEEIRDGLTGSRSHYGLPFLGDNNFLPDRLEEITEERRQPIFWYERVDESGTGRLREYTTRLTNVIDRADMSQTRSALFRPISVATNHVPDSAWVSIGYGAETGKRKHA